MEGSSDFSNDDVWSPFLREDIFSDYNFGQSWDSAANDFFLPSISCSNSIPLDRPQLPPPPGQQQPIQTVNPNPTISTLHQTIPQTRKPLQFDLPNFPLPKEPPASSSTLTVRPPVLSSNHVPQHQPQQPATGTASITSSSTSAPQNHRQSSPSCSSDGESSHSNNTLTDSIGSDSPWSDTDQNFSGFVDLTQEDSPNTMPAVRRSALHRSPGIRHTPRSTALRASTSRRTSDAPSNPAKRRKTNNAVSKSSPTSQMPGRSIQRPNSLTHMPESIDLTEVDDDSSLSKVLEQQRLALIKAQQEEARKPVKLATVQCIICMENMKDLTATSCGRYFASFSHLDSSLTHVLTETFFTPRPSLLPLLPHGSPHRR